MRLFACLSMMVVLLAAWVPGSARAAATAPEPGPRPVDSVSARALDSSSLTLSEPAGARTGELLLATITVTGDATGPILAPAGWVAVPGTAVQITPLGARSESFDRLAGDGSAGADTFTISGAADWVAVTTAYEGVDDRQPVEAAGARADLLPAASLRAPRLTPTSPGATLVYVGVGPHADEWAPPSAMRPAGSAGGGDPRAIGETVAVAAAGSGAGGPVGAAPATPVTGAGILIALASDTPMLAASASASAAGAPALSIPAPAGVAAGDLLLAAVAVDGAGAGALGVPPGWTAVPGAGAVAASGARVVVYETIAADPEAASFSVAAGVPADWAGSVSDVKNPDPQRPIDAVAAGAQAGPSSSVTAPSLTTDRPDTALVLVDAAPAGPAPRAPAGLRPVSVAGGAGDEPVRLSVDSGRWQPANATGPLRSPGPVGAPWAIGVVLALSSNTAESPPPLATTQASNISSGNATLGTTTLSRCANGCRVWTRWRPSGASSATPWTTGPSAAQAGPGVFEAYDLAARTGYAYEVCDNLSGTVCYGAGGAVDAGSAGSAPAAATFTTLSCAAASGGYGASLATGALNAGAMPSYTCPPFADGRATAWSEPAPQRSGTPDPPLLPGSATMVKDILAHGVDNISVGRTSTGWPVYYSSAADPVYRIICSGACPAVTTLHVPAGVRAEQDVDRHLSVIDQSGASPVEFDMWEVRSISTTPCHPCVIHAINAGSAPVGGDSRETGSGGVGADAAHDALQAGALRAEELFGAGFDQAAPQGVSIRHALAIAVPCTADHHDGNEVFPAAGNDGAVCPSGEQGAPEMGQRFVLTAPVAQIEASGEPRWKQNLLLALDDYGAIVVDTNGSANGTSIRYQNDLSYELPSAQAPMWGDPWISFAAAADDGRNIVGYTSSPGGPPTVYSLELARDTWFENELRRYLVAVTPCVSLGDCPAAG